MMKKASDKWYFTKETNAKGLCYIYAYQTQWDPVAKKSKRSARKYVGRLAADSVVNITAKFRTDFPQYAQGTFYFGLDKTLVDEAAYRRDFPDAPGPKPAEAEIDTALWDTRSLGFTWALEQLAAQSQVLEHLREIFKEDARSLLNLAIYKLDGGNSMAAMEDWRASVYLPHGPALKSQRISEVLSRVTPKDFARYFHLRHQSKIERMSGADCVHYALDNTTISSYSATIADVAYGHAKRDPELPVLNFTFVCDQDSGDIVFAHAYEGSIPDVTAFGEIVYRMKDAGFDFSKVILVTDRGYQSLINIQKQIDLEVKFIQGIRLSEDIVKRSFDRYDASLHNQRFYDTGERVYAHSTTEAWKQYTDYGSLNKTLHLHLYRFPKADEAEMEELRLQVQQVLDLKNANRQVPPEKWLTYKRFVCERTTAQGRRYWDRDDNAIEAALRYAGRFAIRTNAEANPFKALSIYRLRGQVEQDFNQFKNWVDGNRLRCTDTAYWGKLLVCTLATSLRMMAIKGAHDREQGNRKIPNNSIDCLFTILKQIQADKRRTANAWVTRTITKKQRDMLALLGLENPPRVLKN